MSKFCSIRHICAQPEHGRCIDRCHPGLVSNRALLALLVSLWRQRPILFIWQDDCSLAFERRQQLPK
jgi:hypothetical protein